MVTLIKVAELNPPELDYWVAKAEGQHPRIHTSEDPFFNNRCTYTVDCRDTVWFSPSTDWSQGGPIIEHNWLELCQWFSYWYGDHWHQHIIESENGVGILVTAMRAYVASKYGDEVNE